MKRHEFPDRASWLEGRKMGIGASEAPALMRCPDYKWSTPYSIWAEKTGLVQSDSKVEEWQQIGLDLEPAISRMYENKTDRYLTDPGDFTIYQSNSSPFMLATIDRFDGDRVVELKNVGGTYHHWSNGVPLHYQVQVQQQMYVCEKEVASIGVLFGMPSFNFQIFEVERNDAFIKAMISTATRFWYMVVSNEAPEVDGGTATTDALRRLRVDDSVELVDLPDEAEEWDIELEQVKQKIKLLNDEKALWENKLKHEIGEAEVGICKGVRLYTRKANKKGARTLRRSLKKGETVATTELSILAEASL